LPTSRSTCKRVSFAHRQLPSVASITHAVLRIGRGDSSENPVLAGGDETLARSLRKFFYCQNSRLRVRERGFQAARVSRDDVVCAARAECVNYRNACSAGLSCNIDKRRRRSLLHFSHRYANAQSCLRATRVARSRIAASTLP
jgi:hypothetical protein